MGGEMTEPSLAVQTAIRTRLVATAAVVALVSADAIFDRSTRPEVFPCVVIGDGQTVNEGVTYSRRHIRVFADLHLWVETASLADVKGLAGAVSKALRGGAHVTEGFICLDLFVSGTRFLRDPGGVLAHAVVAVEALLEEVL